VKTVLEFIFILQSNSHKHNHIPSGLVARIHLTVASPS
jgi:hypothetical protein